MHQLPRRQVWIVGPQPLAADIAASVGQAGAPCRRFAGLDGLDDPGKGSAPRLVIVAACVLEASGGLDDFVNWAHHTWGDSVAVIVVTDRADPAWRQQLFAAGAADFVLLPLADAELIARVDAALARESARAASGGVSRLVADGGGAGPHGLSVLVADAESMVQHVLRAAFERRGWTVARAVDGRQVTELIEDHSFDLVVFDLNLPFKNGFELLDQLGQAPPSQRPLAVAVSAEHHSKSVLRAFELGADDFVQKPVDPDVLVARIQRLAGRR